MEQNFSCHTLWEDDMTAFGFQCFLDLPNISAHWHIAVRRIEVALDERKGGLKGANGQEIEVELLSSAD